MVTGKQRDGALSASAGESVAACENCGTQQTLPTADDDMRRSALADDKPDARKESAAGSGVSVGSLLKQGFLLLEKGDWQPADACFDRLLEIDAAYAPAYFGKLCAELQVGNMGSLAACEEPFDGRVNYQQVMRFADPELKKKLEGVIAAITERSRASLIYDEAVSSMQSADTERAFLAAAERFRSIHGFRDAAEKETFCLEKAEEVCKPVIPASAEDDRPEAPFAAVEQAQDTQQSMPGTENAGGQAAACTAADKLLEAEAAASPPPPENAGGQAAACTAADKLLEAEAAASPPPPENAAVPGIVSLCERGQLFLEDGEWESAFQYFDRVLDIDPKCAPAYVGKLCAALHAESMEGLAACEEPFEDRNDYRKAVRFADAELGNKLAGIVTAINERNEQNRMSGVYDTAVSSIQTAYTEQAFQAAAEQFRSIPGFRDAAEKEAFCLEKAEQERIAARKRKRRNSIVIAAMAAVVAVLALVQQVIYPGTKYNNALALMEAGEYEGAIAAFTALGDYRDAQAQVKEAGYRRAAGLLDANEYEEAMAAFTALGDYRDAQAQVKVAEYGRATGLRNAGNYDEAIAAFTALGNYGDAEAQVKEAAYGKAKGHLYAGEYHAAAAAFYELGDYKDARRYLYTVAERFLARGDAAKAAITFWKAIGYSDARERSLAVWAGVTQNETLSVGVYHTVGCMVDGTVMATGINEHGQCNVSRWKDVRAVSAGGYHTVGLKTDGTVVAVGNDDFGQCRISEWTDVLAVSAGGYHTVGLKADGTVVAVGNDESGQCRVSEWTDVVAVSAGEWFTVGLKADGTVVAAGDNSFGQCNVSGWTDIVAVSAGSLQTLGVKADRTVVAAGENAFGQCDVSGWTDIVAVSSLYQTVGLTANGTVLMTENLLDVDFDDGHSWVSEWTDIVAVSNGHLITVGLKADGTALVAGANAEGLCDLSGWGRIRVPGE